MSKDVLAKRDISFDEIRYLTIAGGPGALRILLDFQDAPSARFPLGAVSEPLSVAAAPFVRMLRVVRGRFV
jgi:hypothetical protein